MLKKLTEEKGFTLIEMMIVLMIISILLLIAVPTMEKSNEVVSNTTCEATADLLRSQVAAYKMETGNFPVDLPTLETENYVDSVTCPGDAQLDYDSTTGEVSVIPGSSS